LHGVLQSTAKAAVGAQDTTAGRATASLGCEIIEGTRDLGKSEMLLKGLGESAHQQQQGMHLALNKVQQQQHRGRSRYGKYGSTREGSAAVSGATMSTWLGLC
jgi:hypothetical protein